MMKLVVLSCVLAAASASLVGVAPLAYTAPLLTPYNYNYRGPLSLAPGQPANILAADGRPLDTLEVNLDRSAHLVSKALNGGYHLLKKRSVVAPLIAPLAPRVALAHAPLIAPAPLALTHARITPYTHIAPYAASYAPYATYW